ncbi:glycosyl transferase [Hyaloraphidium curvatum]|nr:glycosyl transferase [Hyaloraphidium curvatum]
MRRDAGGGQSPDVFDVAMFNSEMDVLEVRVRELHPVVKRFVLLDCRVTFTGRPKPAGEVAPPGFFANDPRFAPFAAKILHLVVDAFPDTVENITWKREGYLRREALRRAVEHLKPLPGDLFVTADLDEIPRGSALNRLRRCPGWASPAMLTAVGGYYSYDVEGDEWPYPHVWRYMPGIPVPDPGMLRGGRPPSPTRIRMAAWHCSWCLGRVEEFLRKMGDYSHTELDTPRARGVRRLLHSVLTRTDIYDRAVVKFRTSRVRTGPGDMICLR